MNFMFSVGASALLLSACYTAPSSDNRNAPETPDKISITANELANVSSTLFDNEFLRVKRFDVPAGHTLPMHEGHARVVYSLADYTLEWTEKGKPPVEKHWSAGETHSHGNLAHKLTNVGDTTASFLIIERSDKPLPAMERGLVSGHKDVSQADHDHHTPVFEDNRIRLVQVRLNPGESLPSHSGVLRAIYSLNDYELNWTEADGLGKVRQWKTGDVHWHDLGQHSAKNTGNTVAEWLMIEPK